MIATFRNVEDLARYCAQLAKEDIDFEVVETQCVGVYRVTIIK